TVTYAGAMEVETNTSTNTRTIKTYWPMGIGVEIDRPATGSPAVTPPTQLNWLHKDRLGSPIAISGETGALRERLAYDAWGKRRTTSGAATGTPATPTPDSIDGVVDNRGFTGHEMLDQLDLVHMNGRIYDPLIGRFLSADPILQDPMNGQSYNRYSYVMNNPTNFTDPTGFAACGETTTGSNIARSCSAEQKATEKIIASGTYVMNNVDGSRTAFVGGKVAMKTDGKGTVLFDAKAPQAASTAVPPQASNDITVVPRSAPISFGLRDKATEKIDDRVAELGSTPVAKTLGGLSRGIASMIPDTPVEAATALALGIWSKVAALGRAAVGEMTATGELTVYRVFGGDSRAQGFSWTTKDPRTLSNYRDAAGLPSGGQSGSMNTADFMITGTTRLSDVIKSRPALPLDGNKGGLPELIIDPKNVRITDFSVLKP
ncbi:MAG: hypothetical protein ING66_12395, partial [Rhodocyclaceae bacterium]|nr:hypothetical protein [Rhodocyclaceae bacterium]